MHSSLVDIDPCMHRLDKLVRHTLPETLRLTFTLDAPGVHCKLDASQLQNALLNLILNARDATESKGSIAIHSAVRPLGPERAQQLNLPPGSYACISVCDDGCGMDALTRTRVFEPFFTTKRVGQGSGLGLSMVYGFARQSGGAVDVASEPGAGTTVSLWLPLHGQADADDNSDDAADLVMPPKDAPPQGLALLVEDDASVRKVVRRHLLDLGYAVIEAENGEEALDILDQTKGLKVVVSDFVMPGGVDGQKVIAHAVQLGHIPNVVLMSGYPPHAQHPSEVPLIQKPFTREQLSDALQIPAR